MLNRKRSPTTEMTRTGGPWAPFWPGFFDAMDFSPAVDVDESDTHFLLSFDLPGVKKEDVHIELKDNILTVWGERKDSKREGFGNRLSIERSYGEFNRTFTLPINVDPDKIEAHYEDGVLHVVVPKAESAKPREIAVKTGRPGLFGKAA